MASILTNQEVIEIKDLLIEGQLTQQEIADQYNVSRSIVSNIATERSHAGVGPSMLPVANKNKGRLSQSVEERNLYLTGQLDRLRHENSFLRRQANKAAGQTYSIDSFIESVATTIKPFRQPTVKNYSPKRRNTPILESAVLMLSDIHGDCVVPPEEVDGMEDFNFPVAVQRGCHLIQEVVKFTQRSLQGFQFDEIVVLGLGDYTSGEIHEYENYFSDQFTADLALGEFIGAMLVDLSSHFPRVRFHNVTGNHGRVSKEIQFGKRGVSHNHDTLIARIAELYCRAVPNISFQFPNSLSSLVDIKNSVFHLSHGHGKRQASAIWSRAENASQKINGLHQGHIDYFCQGHYHTPGDVQVSGGASLLANGAFLATDQYAYQSLQEAGTPSQTIFGVHAKNKVTWRLPITLNPKSTDINRYPSLERFYK
jgi:transcriptional regulator with XRE-family HTH domain